MKRPDWLRGDPLPWLLEREAPGARYLALRDVAGADPEGRELRLAQRAAHRDGPIAAVLAAMDPAGFWFKPGPGYSPKYRSTVWALLLLAQLGARIEADPRIATACGYLLDHALTPGGQFSALAAGTADGTIDCLQGNLCWALVTLGCDDPRLEAAYAWMARSVTGETRHWLHYKVGPTFACRANGGLPCAWGGVKVMLALGARPPARRSPLIQRAIDHGAEFLLGTDPARARYPTRNGAAPSRMWWNFGFPVFYVTDLLQLVEALARLGYGRDSRLAGAVERIAGKQDEQGRWPLEHEYNIKTWVDVGPKRQPNKWVTLRALRALGMLDPAARP